MDGRGKTASYQAFEKINVQIKMSFLKFLSFQISEVVIQLPNLPVLKTSDTFAVMHRFQNFCNCKIIWQDLNFVRNSDLKIFRQSSGQTSRQKQLMKKQLNQIKRKLIALLSNNKTYYVFILRRSFPRNLDLMIGKKIKGRE